MKPPFFVVFPMVFPGFPWLSHVPCPIGSHRIPVGFLWISATTRPRMPRAPQPWWMRLVDAAVLGSAMLFLEPAEGRTQLALQRPSWWNFPNWETEKNSYFLWQHFLFFENSRKVTISDMAMFNSYRTNYLRVWELW